MSANDSESNERERPGQSPVVIAPISIGALSKTRVDAPLSTFAQTVDHLLASGAIRPTLLIDIDPQPSSDALGYGNRPAVPPQLALGLEGDERRGHTPLSVGSCGCSESHSGARSLSSPNALQDPDLVATLDRIRAGYRDEAAASLAREIADVPDHRRSAPEIE